MPRKPGQNVAIDPVTVAELEDKEYTVMDIARIFGVGEYSARKWCRDGLIEATYLGPGKAGGYKVSREGMMNFAIKRYQS